MTSFLLLLALAAPPGDHEVLARIEPDVTITAGEVRAHARARASAGAAAPAQAILDDLVNDALLARDAEALGMAERPEVKAAIEAERRRLAAERLVVELAGAVNLDDARLRQTFHAVKDTVELELIVVATREEAEAVLSRLKGGVAFAEAAKGTLHPSASAGGKLGTRTRGQLEPALADLAFTAPPGQPAGPVQLQLGIGVLRAGDRSIGDETELAKDGSQFRAFIQKQLAGQTRRHFLDQLRKEAAVQVDEAFLESTGKRIEATEAEASRMIATVHGRQILFSEVIAGVRRLARGKEGGHFSGSTVKREIAWARVDQVLLEDAAIARGLGGHEEVAAGAGRAGRAALARLRVQQLREAVPAPSGAELAAHHLANAAAFTVPAQRTCDHIVVADEDVADDLLERLEDGEKLEELARLHSIDRRSTAAGGRIGVLSDVQLEALAKQGGEPELAAAFRRAAPGRIEGPVRSKAGFHLVRCLAQSPARLRPLAEVRAEVEGRLQRERQDAAIRTRVAELRAKAKVSIDRQALERLARR